MYVRNMGVILISNIANDITTNATTINLWLSIIISATNFYFYLKIKNKYHYYVKAKQQNYILQDKKYNYTMIKGHKK